jgi:hypothetical protein
MSTTRPKTPELDKLRAAKEDLGYLSLSNFVDWLKANHWDVVTRDSNHPVPPTFDQLFACYAELDAAKIEAEVKALVDWHANLPSRAPHPLPHAPSPLQVWITSRTKEPT